MMYSQKRWYLVQCKPRDSFRAEVNLKNQNYECFHPTYPVKCKKKDGVTVSIQPLFPYYLFVLLSDAQNASSIRSTRGVNKIVSFNGIPATLDHAIVEELQRQCERLHGKTPEALYQVGDRVLVTRGCFKQVEAVVTAATGEERITLLLNLFNREHEVNMSVFDVEAVG